MRRAYSWVVARGTDYFLGQDPTFGSAFTAFLVVAVVLFSRWPGTNYIFDEQEALLANPYVNATSGLRFVDAIHRDFWGLPADRSVGSYRPIPDFLWRALWVVSKAPFFHHIYNVLFHAVNAALLTVLVWMWTKRRGTAYLAGAIFCACAVLTEAVSGIVGIADVLGGMGAILALLALSLPAWAAPAGVFVAITFGLFSKESAVVCVPLVPVAAVLTAPLLHPKRPMRMLRGLLAFAGAFGAFFLYVELRKRWFQSPLPEELKKDMPLGSTLRSWLARDFLTWFHQAPLPKDPLNNPLADADTPHRIAGALRVYWRGLTQLVFPKTLSGDYSFPQEPAPETLTGVETRLGGAMMVLPPLAALVMWIVAMVREARARRLLPRTTEGGSLPARVVGLALGLVGGGLFLAYPYWLAPHGHFYVFRHVPFTFISLPLATLGLGLWIEGLPKLASPDAEGSPIPLGRAGVLASAIGLVWIVVSFFPHSNIPVVLPTVRAERFWYFPAIGSSVALACAFAWASSAALRRGLHRAIVPTVFGLFFAFQCVKAYAHATDYRSDLDFWAATKNAVPNSSKAHLNYSVMKGARNDLETRLVESKKAIELAPKWSMAYVYTGDTLCRMHRAAEAWPYYKDGFEHGPNELSLIALALQCLYDEGALKEHGDELRKLADAHEGSWIAYLGVDTLNNAEKNKGVDPKYRPRGYNEGPKE